MKSVIAKLNEMRIPWTNFYYAFDAPIQTKQVSFILCLNDTKNFPFDDFVTFSAWTRAKYPLLRLRKYNGQKQRTFNWRRIQCNGKIGQRFPIQLIEFCYLCTFLRKYCKQNELFVCFLLFVGNKSDSTDFWFEFKIEMNLLLQFIACIFRNGFWPSSSTGSYEFIVEVFSYKIRLNETFNVFHVGRNHAI